ncbi:glycosyltransferase family 2 protein [Candidatus Fermentibacterales bacterium]|nr:glycosyltransferase family 2 protein [Candidatus Fermentibacterales bacterium]
MAKDRDDSDGAGPPRELSIFFPALNEEQNVEYMIAQASLVAGQLLEKWEVIVVDDGSTDSTAAIVARLSRDDPRIRLVSHGRNRGFGEALRSGIRASRYDWVFYSDCDGQFDLSQLEEALALAVDSDIVAGYRRRRMDPGLRLLYSLAYGSLVSLMFWTGFKDVDSSFKLYRKGIFERFFPRSTTGVADFEILYLARRMGFRVRQFPVRHYPRRAGTVSFEAVRAGFFAWVKLGAIVDMWRQLWRLRMRHP